MNKTTVASGTQSVTTKLAAEVAETPFDAIPGSALEAIKRLVIDHVGITYMGAVFTGEALIAYAQELGGRPEAVLIGAGIKVPAELAAGINAQLCRNTDFEETGPGTHVGPLIAHTALAVGQRVGASGRDVLAAAALGYALIARFHFARGADWPRTSVVHHRTAAAAIASRLLGHDAAMTARALSLAWEFPPRTHMASFEFKFKRVSPLAMLSALGAPLFGARGGVQAAVMTGLGFESVPDEIDLHISGYDLAVLCEPPTPFHHVSGEMELKPWVCSRPCSCAMQGIANLIREHAIDAPDVTAIRLRLSGIYLRHWLNDPAPDTYWEAIYSTQWAAAMVLQGIPAGPKWVTEERLADPFSRRLAAMVEITEDPDSTRAYFELRWQDIRGSVEIEAGGETHRASYTMGETLGSPRTNMPEAMVEEKFMEATSLSLSPEKGHGLLEALRRIEEVSDINDVAALF